MLQKAPVFAADTELDVPSHWFVGFRIPSGIRSRSPHCYSRVSCCITAGSRVVCLTGRQNLREKVGSVPASELSLGTLGTLGTSTAKP